jgi:hypothetical protein
VAAGAADHSATEGASVKYELDEQQESYRAPRLECASVKILLRLLTATTVILGGLAIADAATGAIARALLTRDARACAIESYGTNVDIARCYTDRGLTAPENFDARE